MFGNNIVKNGRIHQEIKWNVPVLRHNANPQYFIRYATDSSRVLSDSKFEFSSDPNITLQLTFGTSNITYYVVVVVRSTEEQGRGDYSDIISIAYTSEFITKAVETKACTVTEYVCIGWHMYAECAYIAFTEPHSSWSTSRPDTCQQNLSQCHIPVVPT